MIYFMQILRMMNAKQRQLFVALFDDLSYEREEMEYMGYENDLIEDMMLNHFGIEFECSNQLNTFTEYILKEQHKLEAATKRAMLYMKATGAA